MNEDLELNDLLDNCAPIDNGARIKQTRAAVDEPEQKKDLSKNFVQWSTPDHRTFIPTGPVIKKLIPGFYNIHANPAVGIYFDKVDDDKTPMVRFKGSNVDTVITEIETFWNREELFEKYKLPFKRGILLWGPQGTGKTSIIRMVISDVISRGGIVVNFTGPELVYGGLSILRIIQPSDPVVVIMEDLDSILREYSESSVINIIDGVQAIHKVIFLATTNHPEMLGARIVNRPSRFDQRFKIGAMSPENRMLYLDFLFNGDTGLRNAHDLNKWTSDTDGMSISHIKELFVSTVIIGHSYDSTLARLKSMRDVLKDNANIGFR